MNKLKIAVFGSDADHCSEKNKELAFLVGKEIAKSGALLYTGGGEGIMEAVSKGARSAKGHVVGVIPGKDRSKANRHCSEVIATGEDFFKRSVTLAQRIDGAIIIDGGVGTLSEMGVVYWDLKPIIALPISGGMARDYAGKFLDKRGLTRIREGATPKETVTQMITLIQNRRDLETRLGTVGLNLEIYRNKPKKFVRINPKHPIKIRELQERLRLEYQIETEFRETEINGVYESSNNDIGGYVNGGKENHLFNKYYLIQDLASIICVKELDLKKGFSLLETCAASGMKSILVNDLFEGKVNITALDIDPKRYENMLRLFSQFGIKAETHLTDSTKFEGPKYDRVLVDADCSSEGMVVRYDSKLNRDISGFDAVLEHSQGDILEYAKLQGRLLQNGFNHLKKGGVLVYSTCTLNKYENEEVVSNFLKNNKNAAVIPSKMAKYQVKHLSTSLGVRIIPGKTKGFYLAKITKK